MDKSESHEFYRVMKKMEPYRGIPPYEDVGIPVDGGGTLTLDMISRMRRCPCPICQNEARDMQKIWDSYKDK